MVGILGAALMGLTGGAKGYAEAGMREEQDRRELAKSIVDAEMKMEYESRREERLAKTRMAAEEHKYGLKQITNQQQSELRREEIAARGKETRTAKEESDARAMERVRFQQQEANKRTSMNISDRREGRAMRQQSTGGESGTGDKGLTSAQKLTKAGQLLNVNSRRLQSIDSQLSDPIKSRKLTPEEKSSLSQEKSQLLEENNNLKNMLGGAIGVKSRDVKVGEPDIKLDLEGIY